MTQTRALTKAVFALCVTSVLVACAPAGPGSVDPSSKPPVATDRAVALFDTVCGGAQPSFDTAVARMEANNISTLGNAGIVYSNAENLSFKLVPGQSGEKTCSIVFASRDDNASFQRTIRELGTFTDTGNGLSAQYRNTNAVVVTSKEPQRFDGLNYYNIRLLSER